MIVSSDGRIGGLGATVIVCAYIGRKAVLWAEKRGYGPKNGEFRGTMAKVVAVGKIFPKRAGIRWLFGYNNDYKARRRD